MKPCKTEKGELGMAGYNNSQFQMTSDVDRNFPQKKLSNAEPGALNIGGMGRFQSQQRILDGLETTENANESQFNKKWREAYAVWKLCCSESSLPGVPNVIHSEGSFWTQFMTAWIKVITILVTSAVTRVDHSRDNLLRSCSGPSSVRNKMHWKVLLRMLWSGDGT